MALPMFSSRAIFRARRKALCAGYITQKMLYVPRGFAHGFCVMSEQADVFYMTTEEYAADYEAGICWNDPDLGIDWPIGDPKLSKRDKNWPRLRAADNNFQYGEMRAQSDT